MPFKKGQKRPPNAGRKKGSQNKCTREFRERLDQIGFDIVGELTELFQDAKDSENYDLSFRILVHLTEYTNFKPINPVLIKPKGDGGGDKPPGAEGELTDEELEECAQDGAGTEEDGD